MEWVLVKRRPQWAPRQREDVTSKIGALEFTGVGTVAPFPCDTPGEEIEHLPKNYTPETRGSAFCIPCRLFCLINTSIHANHFQMSICRLLMHMAGSSEEGDAPEYEPEGGALPRACRANQSYRLAALDLEAGILQDERGWRVAKGHVLELQRAVS